MHSPRERSLGVQDFREPLSLGRIQWMFLPHMLSENKKMNVLAKIDGAIPFTGDVDAVKRPSRAEAEEAVATLIRWAGDDPRREGLLDTPARLVRAYEEWFSGYEEDPGELLERTF